ncbi:MAG TPA: peptidase M22 [Opitutus sp.]|nr:peptidase M22 [Opitutus sp.]
MPSLAQLLAAHSPLLVLDAASARVHVGWLDQAQPARWVSAAEEAGVGVFRGLSEIGADPAAARAFVFCDGPGSILGIRTTAMAVRTWNIPQARPIFAYHSLKLVAHALGNEDLAIVADARRDSWHRCTMNSPLQRVPTAALTGRLALPEGFRTWSALPTHVEPVPYSVPSMFSKVSTIDLFRECTAPDAFLHEEPNYATWTAQVHRAP